MIKVNSRAGTESRNCRTTCLAEPLVYWEGMVGTRRLELLTSTVSIYL
jgi:hypothetical protein